MLEQGYIELLGIVDPTQFTNNLDKFLAEREGLLGLAFRSRDNDQTATWLAAGGFTPDGPKDLKRALELPDGEVLPDFRLLFLPPAGDAGAARLRLPAPDARADTPRAPGSCMRSVRSR